MIVIAVIWMLAFWGCSALATAAGETPVAIILAVTSVFPLIGVLLGGRRNE